MTTPNLTADIPLYIFPDSVGIDSKRDIRSGSVSEPLLAYLHGRIEPVHQASIGVAECMKPATPNPKRFEQRAELPLHE